MEIYGGRAGYDFVSFTGEKYQSISRYKDGEITTDIRLQKGDSKVTNILSKIPFIRAFSILIEIMIESWKGFLSTVIVLLSIQFLLGGKSNYYLLFTKAFSTSEMMCSLLVITGLIIKLTPIGKYHSAEHMTAHAYEKGLNLTIDLVKRQQRTHKDCGTNLVISFFICFFILSMIFGDTVWVFLVSWSVGYEMWRIEPKILWDVVLAIGKAIQYLLFTSRPKEKHLIVAIEAMKRLEEKELANE